MYFMFKTLIENYHKSNHLFFSASIFCFDLKFILEDDRTMTQDMSSKIDPFFSNLKFALVGLSAEIEQVRNKRFLF